MARFIGYTCSECQVVRGPSNHWLLANTMYTQFVVQPWSDVVAEDVGVIHLCGEGCAAKVLSRQISAWRA